MNRGSSGSRIGCAFVLLFLILTPLFGVATLLIRTVNLLYQQVADPAKYEKTITELVGGVVETDATTYVSIDPKDIQTIEALGFDPQRVSYEIAANKWIRDQGADIGLGIQLAILRYESVSGTNMGSSLGLEASLRYSQKTYDDAVWLLQRMKEYDVRSWSEAAESHILADYSNYIGHPAGEMGPDGAWPPTGRTTCEQILSKSQDPHIASCNYFDREVSPYFKVGLLKENGFSSTSDQLTQFNALWGWNHNTAYRWKLVSTAAELEKQIAELSLDSMPTTTTNVIFKLSSSRTLSQQFFYWWFDLWGMIPQDLKKESPTDAGGSTDGTAGDGLSPGELSMPIKEGYAGVSTWPNTQHEAYDFGCTVGSPIYAAADGVIVVPKRAGWRYDPYGWGNSVWIDHGGGNFTHYAHLLTASNVRGSVTRGQEIGKCGSTGHSTGPHLHFEVTKLHPDDYATWDDPRALLDPTIYLKVRTSGQ